MAETRKGITEAGSVRRLEYWRNIVERDKAAWASERDKMDHREALFAGTKDMDPIIEAEAKDKGNLKCYHVRNVVAENIESMVDSRVPRPKVKALNPNDEKLARTLEQLVTSWAERHHVKTLNDQAERMGPVQGGVFWLVEWDDSIRTPDGPGDAQLSIVHPKQIIPQAGVYGDVEDMDHICVLTPMTVHGVWQRYGVDVSQVAEEDAGARGREEQVNTEAEIVTVNQLYYRNGRGGIGNLAWTGDVILCDREDYQARRVLRCKRCGASATYTQAMDKERSEELKVAGQLDDKPRRCTWCQGTEFEEAELRDEYIMPGQKSVFMSNDGTEISLEPAVGYKDPESGAMRIEMRGKIPYYEPELFPLKIQKNISVFGKLLGESDVDKMADAQNLVKHLDKVIIDRLLKAGTITVLPTDVKITLDKDQGRVYRADDPSKLAMIKTINLDGEIGAELELEARAYEEARQATGVTDSMQGRRDATATSAKAKEFSASKAEGRMESRRVMKQEAWARIYEMVAKLFLAYDDEGRRVRVEQPTGEVEYVEFNRKDFLKQDDKGNLYYEDGFLFTCDSATSIGESREAMWQEINSAFGAGTLGNPQELSTLILYWGLMEEQAFPGADNIKKKLEERQTQQMQAAQQQPPAGPTPGGGGDPMAAMGGGAPVM